MSRTLVILDRDGVINNGHASYIRRPEDWKPIPGSLEAIGALCQAGYKLALATNQSGIGRDMFDHNDLSKVHDKMQSLLKPHHGAFDYLAYCPHHPGDRCGCRKPEPGMLYEISKKLSIDLSQAYMVGDSLCDIQAAQKAGAEPILVGDKRETVRTELSGQVKEFPTLKDFVASLLPKFYL